MAKSLITLHTVTMLSNLTVLLLGKRMSTKIDINHEIIIFSDQLYSDNGLVSKDQRRNLSLTIYVI